MTSQSGNRGSEEGAFERGTGLRRKPRRRRVVAVTGANTFLGRNIVGLMEEEPDVSSVVVLDLKNARTAGPKTRFYEVDLTQPGVESRVAEILHAEEVDTLVHLAFVTNPTQATAWAHELQSLGTMHVLSACQKHGLAHLIVRSSVLVYGAHPDNPNFLDEDRALRGLHGSSFVADRLDVERQVWRYAEEQPEGSVTVLRMGALLGPTVDNYVSRWLSRRAVPTVMGFDPLLQFVHEVDAVAAVRLAIERPVHGAFNIVAEGVLPLSTVIKLAGRVGLPIPYRIFRQIASLLWVAQLSEAPPSFVALLRYLCVADGAHARDELGFHPVYSSRDAVLDFEGALRLREARLLREAV